MAATTEIQPAVTARVAELTARTRDRTVPATPRVPPLPSHATRRVRTALRAVGGRHVVICGA